MAEKVEFNIKFHGKEENLEVDDFVMVTWESKGEKTEVAVHCSVPGSESGVHLVQASKALAGAMSYSDNPNVQAMGLLMTQTMEQGIGYLEKMTSQGTEA